MLEKVFFFWGGEGYGASKYTSRYIESTNSHNAETGDDIMAQKYLRLACSLVCHVQNL